MPSIETILNKDHWTGREVAAVHIANKEATISRQWGRAAEDAASPEEVGFMAESLHGKQLEVYRNCMTAYQFAQNNLSKCSAFSQQALRGYNDILLYMKDAISGEMEYINLSQTPLIISRSGYEKITEQLRRDAESRGEHFCDLCYRTLQFLLDNPREQSKELHAALRAAERQPVTDSYILENYNKLLGIGYYILPNGKRSDQMSAKAWETAEKKYKQTDGAGTSLYKDVFKGNGKIVLTFNNFDGGTDYHPFNYDMCQSLMNYFEIPGSFAGIYSRGGGKWQFNENPPENLTKLDILILESLKDLYFSTEDRFSAFKEEYPALYEELFRYIVEAVPSAAEHVTDWQPIATFKELSEMGFANYAELLDREASDIEGYFQTLQHFAELDELQEPLEEDLNRPAWQLSPAAVRAETNFFRASRAAVGVAVVDKANPVQFSKDLGLFIEKKLPHEGELLELAGNENKNLQIKIDISQVLGAAIRYVCASQDMTRALFDHFKIKAKEAYYNTSFIEDCLDEYNSTALSVYSAVIGSKTTALMKRRAVLSLFPPLSPEDFHLLPATLGYFMDRVRSCSSADDLERYLRNGVQLILNTIDLDDKARGRDNGKK